MNRRNFNQRMAMLAMGYAVGPNALSFLSKEEKITLTILHTNDVHSRIDPFPNDGGRYAGLGGAARRAKLIKKIRKENSNVLLFDCGDILQGTPYFNVFDGKIEFELMDKMSYDAATIGNHDFDGGIELLSERISESNFAMLNCNYNVSNTPIKSQVQEYKIFDIEGMRIGVTGTGIKLDGLVPKLLYGETQYNDPIASLNETASLLKDQMDCDYVICLSHLGLDYKGRKVSDLILAEKSSKVDMILGGHTHTFMRDPDTIMNLEGLPVLVNQVGWAGIMLGRIDLQFSKTKKKKCVSCTNTWINDWK